MGMECSTNGEEEAYWISGGKSEAKRPLGRKRRRWMYLGEIGWGYTD
jgi:hypothetical protein